MKLRIRCGLIATGLALGIAPGISFAQPAASQRPNVLIIVADDLGFSDLGAFGGEISTPNLNALAQRGLKLTRYYVAPTCSPTRSMLLTGRDNHQAGLGSMRETLTAEQRGQPGYEGYVPPGTPMLSERLKAAGYTTFMSGKWHLGGGKGSTPSDRGFDVSFALVQGAHNHFGMDQSAAYRAVGAAPTYRLNGNVVDWPIGQFSSDYFTNKFLEFLGQADRTKPFFGYLTYTSPHWPLQAPKDVIAKYRGRYDKGPTALAAERIKRMEKLGLVAPNTAATSVDDSWPTLSKQQRAHLSRAMEVYAAMVDRMDQNIGRVIQALKDRGELDNTLIFFMSDNGPEQFDFQAPVNPQDPTKPIDTPIDNSLANMGAGNSYFTYGPAWARAGSSPFRGTKEDTYDGGIHSPAIIAGPGVAVRGMNDSFLHVTDVVPTMLEIAQAGCSPLLEGRDWSSLLAGKTKAVRSGGDSMGWELFFRRAIREGIMKAVYHPTRLKLLGKLSKPGETKWQLFDLATDPGETHDLAAERPDELKRLVAKWYAYAHDKNVVLLKDEEAPEDVGLAR